MDTIVEIEDATVEIGNTTIEETDNILTATIIAMENARTIYSSLLISYHRDYASKNEEELEGFRDALLGNVIDEDSYFKSRLLQGENSDFNSYINGFHKIEWMFKYEENGGNLDLLAAHIFPCIHGIQYRPHDNDNCQECIRKLSPAYATNAEYVGDLIRMKSKFARKRLRDYRNNVEIPEIIECIKIVKQIPNKFIPKLLADEEALLIIAGCFKMISETHKTAIACKESCSVDIIEQCIYVNRWIEDRACRFERESRGVTGELYCILRDEFYEDCESKRDSIRKIRRERMKDILYIPRSENLSKRWNNCFVR